MARLVSNSWVRAVGVLAIVIAGSSAARAFDRVTANVPFPFIVNNVELPKGDYVVFDVSEGSSVLAIESADGRHRVVVNTIPFAVSDDNRDDQSKLAFKELDGRRFLSRITDDEGNTREVQLDAATMTREIATVDGNGK